MSRNPLGESEVKWLQQFATECGELKVWQPPTANRAHLKIELLRFQRGIFDESIVPECNGDCVIKRKKRGVARTLLGKRPKR